jgi:hypothetical protein
MTSESLSSIGSTPSLSTTITTSPVIRTYENGNSVITIYADGTKIRQTNDSNFNVAFPENIDVKITNACEQACHFCHEGSVPTGKHGDLHLPFFKTLRPGTELAIGGGNPMLHPHIFQFLNDMKDQGVLCNLTMHQNSLKPSIINKLMRENLIRGLGISYFGKKDVINVIESDNVVFHVINGVVDPKDLEPLYGRKILILGYKDIRRGASYHNAEVDQRMKDMYDMLPWIRREFKVVSFDNLAIQQLKVRRMLLQDEWDSFYMGDDGQFTMYVDAIEKKYAKSSTDMRRFDVSDTIDTMFQHVKTL